MNRRDAGILVRLVWIRWCKERRAVGFEVPEHHLVPFEDMPEHIKEVDCQIGESVAAQATKDMREKLQGVVDDSTVQERWCDMCSDHVDDCNDLGDCPIGRLRMIIRSAAAHPKPPEG